MGPFSDNDPIVTVQTPDGRTVQLPQSVAQTFGGQLTPVQPSSAQGPTIAPPGAPQGILPPQAAPPPPIAPASTAVPGGQMGAPKRSDGLPSFTAAEADRLDPTNPLNKPPQEITTDQLRKQGEAGVYNAQAKGLNDVAAAGRTVANAEAAQQLTLAGAYHEQNAKIDGLLQKRADDIADQQKQIADRVGQYDQAVKQYADFKVDRSIQHPIVAALGLALGAIGAAWANKSENPAMTALMAQIDKNVQDQLHQHDAMGNVINQKKTGIDIIRAQAQDRTAQYNLAIAGEIERTKRVGDEITARSNSDIVKANWQKTRAELEVKQADALGGAVDKQHAADQQAAQLAEQKRAAMASEGVAYGHLALANKQLTYQQKKDDEDRKLKNAELNEKALHDMAAEMKGKVAATSENGIFDPGTGAVILQPKGEEAIKQAEGFEGLADNFKVAASKATDPDVKQKLLDAAKQHQDAATSARAFAQTDGAFTIADPKAREKARDAAINGNKMADLIGQVRIGLRDGSIWDRNNLARMSSLYNQVKTAYGRAEGARLNEGEFGLLDGIFGGDPSEWKNIMNMELGRTDAKLDAALQTVVSNTTAELKGYGFKGTWRPARIDADAKPPSPEEKAYSSVVEAKTPTEQAEGAKRGMLGTALTSDASPLKKPLGWLGVDDEETGRDKAQNQKQSGYGLLPEQQAQIDMLVRGAKPGPDGVAARDVIMKLVTGDRPSISAAVLNQLREENPPLYREAIDKLPPDIRQQRISADTLPSTDPRAMGAQAHAAVMSTSSIGELTQGAIAGDQASKQELYRRMAGGDKQAQAAVAQVVRSIGAR